MDSPPKQPGKTSLVANPYFFHTYFAITLLFLGADQWFHYGNPPAGVCIMGAAASDALGMLACWKGANRAVFALRIATALIGCATLVFMAYGFWLK